MDRDTTITESVAAAIDMACGHLQHSLSVTAGDIDPQTLTELTRILTRYAHAIAPPDPDEDLDDEPQTPEEAPLSASDIAEFNAYLANCTDAQVNGVFDKEQSAGRYAYAELARAEARKRNIVLDNDIQF